MFRNLERRPMAYDLATELDTDIPLYQAIQSLRQELQASINQAKDQTLRFGVEKVEVELEICMKKTASTDGKVDIKLFAVGGSKATEHGVTAKFKLELTPKLIASGREGPVDVSDRVEGGKPAG